MLRRGQYRDGDFLGKGTSRLRVLRFVQSKEGWPLGWEEVGTCTS